MCRVRAILILSVSLAVFGCILEDGEPPPPLGPFSPSVVSPDGALLVSDFTVTPATPEQFQTCSSLAPALFRTSRFLGISATEPRRPGTPSPTHIRRHRPTASRSVLWMGKAARARSPRMLPSHPRRRSRRPSLPSRHKTRWWARRSFSMEHPQPRQQADQSRAMSGILEMEKSRLDRSVGIFTHRQIPSSCTAPGFLDSGLTVFASTPPRPARGGRVAPGPGFGSRTSPASTARCTSA